MVHTIFSRIIGTKKEAQIEGILVNGGLSEKWFWESTYQTLTCDSLSPRADAKYILSGPTMYCCRSNSNSNRSSCSGVKIVLILFILPLWLMTFCELPQLSCAFEDLLFGLVLFEGMLYLSRSGGFALPVGWILDFVSGNKKKVLLNMNRTECYRGKRWRSHHRHLFKEKRKVFQNHT